MDEVFAFLSEPSNYPSWQPSLVEMCPRDPGSPGTVVADTMQPAHVSLWLRSRP